MITVSQIESLFLSSGSLPYPQWDRIRELIQATDASTNKEALDTVLKTWLVNLASAVSSDAAVFVGNGLLLLASSPSDRGEDLLRYSMTTRTRIESLLSGLFQPEEEWTWVVITLSDVGRFYDYINYSHLQDGEYGGAGGMFISSGYPHVVIGPGEQCVRRATIAHELTHNYLHGRELPLWLEEGLAQTVEENALGTPLLHIDRELRNRHQAFWSEHGLIEFWSGEAFHMAGDVQKLAYELALVLLRSIISHRAKHVGHFVRNAQWHDGGESAALEVLGTGLSFYIGSFLGPGTWAPAEWTRRCIGEERG